MHRPAAGMQFLVSTVERTAIVNRTTTPAPGPGCVNGSAASSCLFVWDGQAPLPVDTGGAPTPQSKKSFRLFAAAPVLNGWVS